ncbi:lysylphosphatidylglycerol synthase transmembrane domain-containing protein [Anaerotignum sp.]|uniref:lysylphosphatidylglycerol synthase transmembrane domain-containing protein n=1 Tax=Anaerotignum sp. TaxID=2039241 RepID=UPI00289ACEB4|nr:lysylphosphatidylglycerol synthase transmembrane domain-containing protein [Anaerotignum sp.]
MIIRKRRIMSKRKIIGNFLFLGFLFIGMVYYVFHGKDMERILEQISNADMFYWICAVFCVIMFIGSESVIIYYLMRNIRQKIKLAHCFLYSFIGFFFSCITPSASGGQPAQVYFMRKDDIPVEISALVLMIVTITYKLVLIALGVGVLIVRPQQILESIAPVKGIFYLGLILNIVVVGFMIFMIFDTTLAKHILNNGIGLLSRFGVIKQTEKLTVRVETAIEKYKDAASYFKKHKIVVWNVFLMSILQRLFLFYVTYLVYKSFGLHGTGFITIIFLQGVISVAVDMLPFPGGVGISEKLFLLIFTPIFGHITLPAMVVSRGLSYYTELLLSALLTAIAYFRMVLNRREDIR